MSTDQVARAKVVSIMQGIERRYAEPNAVAASAPAATLLEREAELGRMSALLEGIRNSGEGACVLVSGEAGIGKTSLVDRFAQLASPHVRSLRGGCEALFAPHPLGPLVDMTDELPPALADGIRSGRPLYEIFPSFLALLRDARCITLLTLEDVQWADEATLDFLKYLGRRVHHAPVMLLVTYRDDELSRDHPLRRVLGDLPVRGTHRLVVPQLSEQAVGQLARQAGREAGDIYRITDGNPFFVTELLAFSSDSVPISIRDAMNSRLARLSPSARAVAELASLSPVPVEVELACVALGTAADRAIDECVAQGLLRASGAHLVYRHELARKSVERELPPARRWELHAAMFRALQDTSARARSLSRMVHHAMAAGLDRDVCRLAPIAANEAARSSAHREAADLYALAIARAEGHADADQAALLEARARECMLTNRPDEAIEARTRALAMRREQGDRLHEGIDLRELARSMWNRSADPKAAEYARAAIDVLQTLPPGGEMAMALSVMAHLYLVGDQMAAAIEWGNRAIALAEKLDDAEALSHALNTVGTAGMRTRHDPLSLSKLEQSLAIALRHDLDEHVARAYHNLYIVSVLHRDYVRGLDYAARGIEYCDQRDMDMFSVRLRVRRAYTLIELGRWAEAQRDLAALDGPLAPSPLERPTYEFVQGLLGMRQGIPEATSGIAKLAGAIGMQLWFTTKAAAVAEAEWLRGNNEGVMQAVVGEFDAAMALGEHWRIGQLAVWLRRVGRLPDDFCHPVARPYALELAGRFREAAGEWAKLGCPYDQALALVGGDEAAMRDGLRILDELGARAAAERVRKQLRESGARRVERGPYGHARSDPQGLTRREREIHELLARGMSNEQIARKLHRSTRTVEHHVSAILAKLGFLSRAEAIAAARDVRGLKDT